MAYVPARKYGVAAYHRRRGLGSFCDDYPAECYAGAPVDPQAAAIQAALAAATACTCLPTGVCKENGNSCAYVPVTTATSAAAQAQALQQQATAANSFTAFLNANSGTVTLVGIGLALLMFMGGRRR